MQNKKWRKQNKLSLAVIENRKALQRVLNSNDYWKDEIIIDNFAGGGGASTGIELAIGRSVDVAINHDPAAIAMHEANHPQTHHYCEDVWAVDPRTVMPGRRIGLVWLSPDCTHHSKARGGKPRKKNIRGLAWVAVRWASTRRPRVIMLENVEEFQDWGPLDENGKPIKAQKGRTFRTFVNALRKQGYEVEWKVLKACDYGAPTTRKRLFLVARCDGLPIVWPEPTHRDPKLLTVASGKLPKYRTAAEIIDWSIPCPSIFERKKPLVENTMKRIARGIQKFVMENPNPFIMQAYGGGYTGPGQPIDRPLPTITQKDHNFLIAPTLIQYHSETTNHEARGQSLDRPIMTLDTSPRYGLVSAFIVRHFGTSTGHILDQPLGTATTINKSSLVTAFLMQYYGASVGQEVTDPLYTVTTKDRFGLVTVHGQDYQIVDIGMRMLTPRELYNAQGFPVTYIINPWYKGKPFTQAEQVAKCGNSVSPVLPNALVRANMPEHCVPELSDRYSIAEWEMMLA